ncbi:hypothetical protein RI054_23g98320 [Pseudoscourfieldia marina]
MKGKGRCRSSSPGSDDSASNAESSEAQVEPYRIPHKAKVGESVTGLLVAGKAEAEAAAVAAKAAAVAAKAAAAAAKAAAAARDAEQWRCGRLRDGTEPQVRNPSWAVRGDPAAR